MNADKKADRE
jgi:hypothetical protein